MPSKGRIPFYNPLDPLHPRIWPDYSLVLPVCAVGNIGQLACDLIISTLLARQECHLIGRIYSPSLMPVVGPNAFTHRPGLPPTTSTEVYESKKHKLVIIQQRTSYFKSLKHIYIEELVNWVKEAKFDQLLVLTSSFAQCNPDLSLLDAEIGSSASCPISCITTKSFDNQSDRWKRLNLKQVPPKKQLKIVSEDGLPYLPGSGLTKPLIRACEKAFIPAAFLIDFCSEGINLHDCYQVVNILGEYWGLTGDAADDALQPASGATGLAANIVDTKKVHLKKQQEKQIAATSPTAMASDQPIPSKIATNVAANADHIGSHESTTGGQHQASPMEWIEPYSWARAQC